MMETNKEVDIEKAKDIGRSRCFRKHMKDTNKYVKMKLLCDNSKLGRFGAGV